MLLALATSVFFGVSDFFGGYAARRIPTMAVTTVTYFAATAVLAVAAAAISGVWSTGAVLVGIVTGAVALVGFVTFYAALAAGAISLVTPAVALLQSAVPVVIGVAALGERLGPQGWAGVAVALLAAPLLGIQRGEGQPTAGKPADDQPSNDQPGNNQRTDDQPGNDQLGDRRRGRLSRRALVLTVVSGLSLGLSVVTLNAAPADSGVVPVLVEVILGSVVLGALVLATRRHRGLRRWAYGLGEPDGPVHWRSGLRHAFVTGALLGLGEGFLMAALRTDALSVVAVVVGLYPLATVVLATLILRERLSVSQFGGVGLAIAGTVLLGLN